MKHKNDTKGLKLYIEKVLLGLPLILVATTPSADTLYHYSMLPKVKYAPLIKITTSCLIE